MTLDDLTLLVPLYASKPLIENVIANIDSHLAQNARILCSDQHGLDDAAATLRDRYRGDARVRILSSNKGGNWVSNWNLLINQCETGFYRTVPHDDTATGEATALQFERLLEHPNAVLCHGWVRAESTSGTRLPERDEPNLPLRPIDDAVEFSAGVVWQGLYNGAFKSVVRRDSGNGSPLLVRPTPSLRHSERAWLFAMSLLGDFVFDERASMTKRYWRGSLTDAWKQDGPSIRGLAAVMIDYCRELVLDQRIREDLETNIAWNAARRAAWLDGELAERPRFVPVRRTAAPG